tara:strand:- start:346 stop:603 length:258 start_codon:yes stop_codon:yes gene_type:complete
VAWDDLKGKLFLQLPSDGFAPILTGVAFASWKFPLPGVGFLRTPSCNQIAIIVQDSSGHDMHRLTLIWAQEMSNANVDEGLTIFN